MAEDINIIDLFAGAGGLSEGFFNEGYNFVSHIEMDKHASETLRLRALYHSLKQGHKEDDYYSYLKEIIDIKQLSEDNEELSVKARNSVINKKISDETEACLFKEIRKRMKAYDIGKIDGVIGGPPCQAYSLIGRGRDPECMRNDDRNYLYRNYIHFLKEFEPDFFVFENVPGMLSAQKGKIYKNFENALISLGYKPEKKILNAEKFNVLQSRNRLIVIGHKLENSFFEEEFKPDNHDYKVKNLLNDLPHLQPGEGTDSSQSYNRGRINNYLKNFEIRIGKKDVLIQHKARKHNENDRKIYRKVIDAWNTEERRLKYKELPEELKTHNNIKSFEDRFKVVAENKRTSHTIVAHLSKDGHYHIHPDESQARSITVREAARIQSFPDNFKFEGPMTAQYRQVGNAVPPLMAKGIANRLKKFLNGD